MIGTCAMPADTGLVAGLTGSVDCATRAIAAGGYGALATTGGPVAGALTGLLTLYVAFMGYRLLLGRGTLDVGGVSVAAIKIGLVVVLAGNWAVYQQVVCATLFDAPAAVARLLSGGMQVSGGALDADPFVALQQAFDELSRDVRVLAGHAGTGSPLLGGTPFAAMMLNAQSYGLVFASVGVLVASQLGLAILLAMAPLVAGFLLFEATRGLVEGWLRAMIALALVSLTTTVLMPIELAMLEPVLLAMARDHAADMLTTDGAMKASFVMGVFALVRLASVFAALTIARGLRLPRFGARSAGASRTETHVAAPARTADPALARAAQVAAAADAAARRGTIARPMPAAQLQGAMAAGDRVRGAGAAYAPIAGATAPVHIHRAARPRRELLVSRRKR